MNSTSAAPSGAVGSHYALPQATSAWGYCSVIPPGCFEFWLLLRNKEDGHYSVMHSGRIMEGFRNFLLIAEYQKPGTGLRSIAPDACRPGYIIEMSPKPQRG